MRHLVSGAANRISAGSPYGTAWWVALVHKQPLLLLAGAAFTGILAASTVGRHSLALWVLAAISVTLMIPLLTPDRRWLAVVAIFVPVFAVRHVHNSRFYHSAAILSTAGPNGQPAVIEGMIDKPVTLRRHPLADQLRRRGLSPWQTQIEVTVQRFRVGHQFRRWTGRVLIVCDGRIDELLPGDKVRVFGSLRQFTPPTNPGERDLRAVYRRRHLHARMSVNDIDQVVVLDHGKPWGPSRWIASFAVGSRDLLLRHTGDSTGPLAVALVIGQRDYVDNETRDLLLVTGTAHLLSVSGLHLAIIVLMARWFVTLLPIPSALKIGGVIVICLLYTAITGARPPVVRAAVLVVAVMLSIWIRRPSQPINTLSLAALLLIAYNPELLFSVGVQLSFLAVSTLLICGNSVSNQSPVVSDADERMRRLQSLVDDSYRGPIRWFRLATSLTRQMIWFSLCVTTVSMPLVWHQFNVVSPISVIANVVLGPMMFIALGSGVTTVVCGWIAEPLAVLPGFVCDQSLRLMRMTIDMAASINGGHFWLPTPPTWLVIAFYLLLAVSLCRPGRIASRFRRAMIVIWIPLAYGIATHPAAIPTESLEATFVDVGHGTCVVLRFGDDDVWLYDCGRLGNDVGSSRDIDATLWSLGITRLDGIFLSHADADHFNALPGVLKRFKTTRIVTPPGMLSEPEGALVAARAAIDQARVPIHERSAGDELACGRWRATVLHPPPIRQRGSDNAYSLVLRIDHGGKTFLLPGDLEPPGTQTLIDLPRPPAGGILMAPHHGSMTMNAESVLQWARPRETIVSGGQRARRPEVQQMLAVTGSGVHVTASDGAIRVRVGRDGQTEVRSWLRSPW